MPDRPRILLVSEVVPSSRNPGGLVLARHLADYPDVLAVVPSDRSEALCPAIESPPGRLWRLQQRHPESRMLRSLGILGLVSPLRLSAVAKIAATFRPDVVLAVAHGETAFVALRLTRRFGFPLALVFHDWWPDFVSTRHRELVDHRFRRLYRRSAAAFCVSESLRALLGPHPRAVILPPCPGSFPWPEPAPVPVSPFEVHYSGNLTGCYRAPMVSLLRALRNHAAWALQLTGLISDWDPHETRLATEIGHFRGFVSEAELARLRYRAGAQLVVLSFHSGDRRRVETSFPSKLVEYCQTPRPIIIWGPAGSAAARWAVQTQAALVVTSPDPGELIRSVERLMQDHPLQTALIAAARSLAETTFSPRTIRQIFDEGLATCRLYPSASAQRRPIDHD